MQPILPMELIYRNLQEIAAVDVDVDVAELVDDDKDMVEDLDEMYNGKLVIKNYNIL